MYRVPLRARPSTLGAELPGLSSRFEVVCVCDVLGGVRDLPREDSDIALATGHGLEPTCHGRVQIANVELCSLPRPHGKPERERGRKQTTCQVEGDVLTVMVAGLAVNLTKASRAETKMVPGTLHLTSSTDVHSITFLPFPQS